MRSVAIIKPDHVGDLVLAVPAINWVATQSSKVTLFVRTANVSLAQYLFPGLQIEAMDFPHLNKGARGNSSSLQDCLKPATGHDVAVILRTDHVFNRERLHHLLGPCVFSDSRDDRHESTGHRFGLRVYFGDYESEPYWTGCKKPFPPAPKTIGLCVGSGFPTNKWSVIRWVELGRRLMARGCQIRLIGGLQERQELALLSETMGLNSSAIIEGGRNIAELLAAVAQTDVVIASDGGAGHLCSLAAPVLTVAASVPFRRFAPFGCGNRVVSMDLPCSPCMNAHDTHMNICFSHECSYGITVEAVLTALDAGQQSPGSINPLDRGAKLFHAVSHA